jgi:hypothetical protein
MSAPDDPFADLIAWKFAGAAAWHTALFGLGAAAWHLAAAPGSGLPWRLLSFSGLLQLAALYLTSLGVLYAQRRLLAAADVPPVHLPALGLFASRCVLRTRKLPGLVDALLLYAACAASGVVGVATLAGGAVNSKGVAGGLFWLLCGTLGGRQIKGSRGRLNAWAAGTAV